MVSTCILYLLALFGFNPKPPLKNEKKFSENEKQAYAVFEEFTVLKHKSSLLDSTYNSSPSLASEWIALPKTDKKMYWKHKKKNYQLPILNAISNDILFNP